MPAFSPDVARGLEVGRGDGNTLVVFPPGGHRWVLEPSPDGYIPHPPERSNYELGSATKRGGYPSGTTLVYSPAGCWNECISVLL
ncbi:hypothetical protein CC1G_15485 [Coprinopsis cinerea okayama7|uniref:Uncharacterized protein n=1 Tax=Coprinopsis cinerea (strain Okayama-7 / 130 / ATCC MYA-4618 / FGSC 9003) TaxID=240176 RepID=D6RQW9_COPC7|nr:hypothetical protein CC1G_15485 [Coprinopsis cinerea okayama7\|eukprot:XP_002910208.1 hypothetical protein CC1G_15485 [Coprinopsis cinerea okayama7\